MITPTHTRKVHEDESKPHQGHGAHSISIVPSVISPSSASSPSGTSVSVSYAGQAGATVQHGSKSLMTISSDDEGWELIYSFKFKKGTPTSADMPKVSFILGSSSDTAPTTQDYQSRNQFQVLMDHDDLDMPDAVDDPIELFTEEQPDKSEAQPFLIPNTRHTSAFASAKGTYAAHSKPHGKQATNDQFSHTSKGDKTTNYATKVSKDASNLTFSKLYPGKKIKKINDHTTTDIQPFYFVTPPLRKSNKFKTDTAYKSYVKERIDHAFQLQYKAYQKRMDAHIVNWAFDESIYPVKPMKYSCTENARHTHDKPIQYNCVQTFNKSVDCAKASYTDIQREPYQTRYDSDNGRFAAIAQVREFERAQEKQTKTVAPNPNIAELCRGLHRKGLSTKKVTQMWIKAGGKPEDTPLSFDVIARERANNESQNKDRRRRHSPKPNWGKHIRQLRGARYYGKSFNHPPANRQNSNDWSSEIKDAMQAIFDSYLPPQNIHHQCNAVSIYTVHTGEEDDGEEEKAESEIEQIEEGEDTKPDAIFVRRSKRLKDKASFELTFDTLKDWLNPNIPTTDSLHETTIPDNDTSSMPSLAPPDYEHDRSESTNASNAE
ncbi:hypothetical protein, partial [Janthinobacterium sp.]|uniref:hypothetical protein n=1 Tax=Janthinobacterium sp. TaxID=1871054 RepID=UPI00293DA02F